MVYDGELGRSDFSLLAPYGRSLKFHRISSLVVHSFTGAHILIEHAVTGRYICSTLIFSISISPQFLVYPQTTCLNFPSSRAFTIIAITHSSTPVLESGVPGCYKDTTSAEKKPRSKKEILHILNMHTFHLSIS